MIMNDKWIRSMCVSEDGGLIDNPMIEPFRSDLVRSQQVAGVESPIISFGTSSYGYDVRCSEDFKVFTNVNSSVVDPKGINKEAFVDVHAPTVLIPPNGFALARTVEYIRVPDDCLVLCIGKSTYARCGIILNVTPLEPGWEGHVTLEISNTTPLPAKIYANEGIAQFLFLRGDKCETNYRDRGGKYQGQLGITLPRV